MHKHLHCRKDEKLQISSLPETSLVMLICFYIFDEQLALNLHEFECIDMKEIVKVCNILCYNKIVKDCNILCFNKIVKDCNILCFNKIVKLCNILCYNKIVKLCNILCYNKMHIVLQ